MKKQVHVYYAGRVQGVGFRFTTQDLARELMVSGWVKNLREGRVELLAEAEEGTLHTCGQHGCLLNWMHVLFRRV